MMKTKNFILTMMLLGCLTFAFSSNLWAQQAISGSFTSGTEIRSYIGAIPDTPQTPLKLVIMFSGANEDAAQMELRGFNDFIGNNTMVVYPEPFSAMMGFGNSAGVDDLQMVEDLITDVASNYSIDVNEIYIGGFSNGGIFTYSLVCDFNSPSATRAYAFKAFAVVSGAMPDGGANTADCPIASEVPLIAFHGTGDLLISYNGGFVFPIGLTAEATDTTINFWATAVNGCNTPPTVTSLPDPVIEVQAPSTVERLEFGCSNSIRTVLYRIDGGLHAWPGGSAAFDIQQDRNRDINASELIAAFFASEDSTNNTVSSTAELIIGNNLVSVYPNPVNDVLSVETAYNIQQFEVLNAMGQTVLVETQASSTIYLGDLISGLYILRITMDEGVAVERIVKN